LDLFQKLVSTAGDKISRALIIFEVIVTVI